MTKLTQKTFKETYFYKTDLVKICRNYGLPTQGTKAELNHYIDCFLSGIPANQIKPARTYQKAPSLKMSEISLDTPLVGSGFSFNNEARQFFATYFNVKKFSFTKEMAVIKRKAEADQNLSITVGDLINRAKEMTDSKQTWLKDLPEEQTYQWNNFVKGFCNSPKSHELNRKMKVAAILWHHVKHSTGSKQYHDRLLDQFSEDIKPYHIKNH
ncbi:SAP domain-containing protein [Lentilactobacillus hilgardii]|uniref:SAP domain-containing protein n=1 Tax=Lentilactobacillus hilgardii (strain ATCC 8290 / DSM 20176 / CCUG 30140 / JCM 1155 / KCTC 3500 / NBRC 15886 / NCIMB 8040 / NRRL B-1843 / 9) TaxID=1423757 RepID=C0XIR2_LENH9|nr:SAP domain-containing protein [Lentilactobacillus hilgardii]EEI24723.1 hypothetical protein HMPREF0519_1123 [Lentilactobacillus hilgardii DSM 20176 = ATCC 8290]KRK57611.1 hypothetical protein FD42_GL002180 [Lentilactobacillus hilgardii DSM 20176 = ATCC 8290]QEU37521.1 SAP domain-containing protein [Lentilactobacillus hilgardii]TDG83386.1 hypothetical protein C5L34_001908 [Lentilactobacillus hilgardii]